MTREWKPKPGDVAMVRYRNDDGPWVVGIATTPNGNWRTQEHGSTFEIAEARPLVVIDPEDREQVEVLRAVAEYAFNDVRYDGGGPTATDLMRSALRKLVDPKPEEPTGLGAVVKDANEVLWVRVSKRFRQCSEPNKGRYLTYDQITAVKVLSEGVQP